MSQTKTSSNGFPAVIQNQDQLEEVMSRPGPGVKEELSKLDGDLLVLGVGGKMGPSLARQARRAFDEVGSTARVIGVSRFGNVALRQQLESWGIHTIQCDLLDSESVAQLPDAGAIIFMAGMKFGASSDPSLTWAMNTHLPTLIASRYPRVPTVVFSSGNVYPLVPVDGDGAAEHLPAAPIGEYAQSVLGRERIFEYFSRQLGTKIVHFRLFYAAELRYGILYDVASAVWQGRPVNVDTGYANCIWQGDANAMALRSLEQVDSPPKILNVTSPDRVAFRDLAHRFGELLGKTPQITGQEQETAFLADVTRAVQAFGKPAVDLDTVIQWVANWVRHDGTSLNKPTHFEVRNGQF